jgi:hypothetical protein
MPLRQCGRGGAGEGDDRNAKVQEGADQMAPEFWARALAKHYSNFVRDGLISLQSQSQRIHNHP